MNDVNNFPLGIQQYDVGGPAMHGLLLSDRTLLPKMMSFDDWLISANFDITLPKIPGKVFADLALVSGRTPFFDIGIKKSFGPLLIIIPLYQNWELESPVIKDSDLLFKRMRLSLNFSDFNIQNFF